ncbi:MAG: hypothetical protein JWQ13_440 [Ramlibacter sp.]|jgi:general stress protein YciG|nr:hypothetical protein [Ramlibacter sp.]
MTLDDSKQNDAGSKGKTRRGFAVMNPERQREIARLGGIAAHRSGHAHQFTTEEARAAGKKRHEPRNERPA